MLEIFVFRQRHSDEGVVILLQVRMLKHETKMSASQRVVVKIA